MSKLRSTEVQVTREFSGATPVWTNATIYTIAEGSTDVTIPVLGNTQYAVRSRTEDVFSQYSAWSTHTTHTTAVGADSQGVSNLTATVTVEADGLHVRNGAVFIEDPAGNSVLNSAGFGGTWLDFLRSGLLYNSGFQYGDTTDIAVTEVGTASTLADYAASTIQTHLPYWVVAASGGTVKIVTDVNAPGGKALEMTGSASQVNRIYQDIPANLFHLSLTPVFKIMSDFSSASDHLKVIVSTRDKDHAIIGGRITIIDIPGPIGAAGSAYEPQFDFLNTYDGGVTWTPPAVYMRVEFEVTHFTAASSLRIGDFFSAPAFYSGHEVAAWVGSFDTLHSEDITAPLGSIDNLTVQTELKLAADLRLRSTGVRTMTLDDNGGAAALSVLAMPNGELDIFRSAAAGAAMVVSVIGDTSPFRFVLSGDGSHAWGPSAAARDLRLRRSAAATMTIDDTAAGPVTVNIIGTLQQGGVGVSTTAHGHTHAATTGQTPNDHHNQAHGATDHTNITRSIWLEAGTAGLDTAGATLVTLGATPKLTKAVALADTTLSGAYWDFMVPDDWDSGVLTVQPVWAPGATDAVAHTVLWTLLTLELAAGVDVTAAGTSVNFTGASAARTANIIVYDTATSTTVTPSGPNKPVRLNVQRRSGDTYVGVVNLLGVIVTYTANQ